MVFDKELDENLKVCPKCESSFSHRRARTHSFAGRNLHVRGDGRRHDERGSCSISPAWPPTPSGSRNIRKATDLKDAVLTGICKIGEHRVGAGRDGFQFLGGSMGSVVGEKLTRLIERATEKELPVIIISTSGGARM